MFELAHYPCYVVMFVMAAAASYTDLRTRKIPNALIKAGLRGVILLHVAITASGLLLVDGAPSWHGPVTSRLIDVAINASLGAVVAISLYALKLWSAGDGKLAIVLVLAQPAWIELAGPVPWAPMLVLYGNALIAALVFVASEAVLRGTPRLVRAIHVKLRSNGQLVARSKLWAPVRVAIAMVAVVTAIAPLRQWISAEAGVLLSGGTFIALAVLYLAYHPLYRITATTPGLLLAVVAFIVSVCVTLWLRGLHEGGLELLRSAATALSVLVARGVLSASSRTFDARAVRAAELEPGMVLGGQTIQLMSIDERWQEAFLPHVGELQDVKLGWPEVMNIREWHAHNVPDQPIWVRVPLPFAPAMAVAVLVTAVTSRLMIPAFW